ncbi:MAG TPA: helix-turn-helix domain-containing protein, partial [Frankiaceae bacterium]|nr:helix-turn-helix domain-containing protein [Frankiaceae bacterium]
APYLVLVVHASRPLTEARPTDRRVENALREQLGRMPARPSLQGSGLLVATRLGLLVAIVPHTPAASVGSGPAPSPANTAHDETDALVARAAEALDRETGLRWRIGVSRPRTGGAGVRAGFQEASRAVELADALSWPSRIVHAQALLIYQVLARDSEAMRELISATLLPLRGARGGAEPLLETLRAYFAAGGVATSAARSLHLSVRALTYRLERIARLTGHDPTDPEDRFALQAATVGQQLLGWP